MKLFGVLFLILSIVTVAEVISVNKENARGPEHNPDSQIMSVECVSGYKFAIYTGSDNVALSQILTLDQNGSLTPAMCDNSPTTAIIGAKKKTVNWMLYLATFGIILLCSILYVDEDKIQKI